VLTPAERAAQSSNGNGHVNGSSNPVGDVGAPVQR
jgi:hypothetical protein